MENEGLQVLLVDDNPVNREACGALLSLWGIEPVQACDGAQAVRLVQERRFDLVLMDVAMPVLDGLAATQQIRRFEREHRAGSSVPIVAYSSQVLPPATLVAVGLSAALRKPSDAIAMSECLRRWCGQKFPPDRPATPDAAVPPGP